MLPETQFCQNGFTLCNGVMGCTGQHTNEVRTNCKGTDALKHRVHFLSHPGHILVRGTVNTLKLISPNLLVAVLECTQGA